MSSLFIYQIEYMENTLSKIKYHVCILPQNLLFAGNEFSSILISFVLNKV